MIRWLRAADATGRTDAPASRGVPCSDVHLAGAALAQRSPILSVLPSESITAELLQATDWAATPLGPPHQWPEALRAAVGICMNSRFPMFIWWGESLVNLYNDAYAPVLGKRHPNAFGRPAREVWHEIWDVLERQVEAVMHRGEATWNERVLLVMERNGFSEETYFTWSYSPIPDGRGGVGGLFCACTEETPRVLIERERDLLLEEVAYERSQLAEAFARSPVCMALVRTPDYTFEYVNERYVELIGGRDPTGLSVQEALPELADQGFIALLDDVVRTGRPISAENAPVRLRRGADGTLETRYVDFTYQPMFAPDGRVNGVLGHGVDVTERHVREMRDRFAVQLDEAVRPLTDAAGITRACAALLGEYLDVDRCAYADVESDENTFNLTGDYTRGVPSIVGRYTFDMFGQEVLALMRAGEVYRVDDVEIHQPPVGDLARYHATQIRAVICVPVLKAGRFVAAMAVHMATPRHWTDEEVELVVQTANRCWESIERARVQRELARSEQRYRAAISATSNIVWNCAATGEVLGPQPSWEAFTGQVFPENAGYGWMDAVHPDDREESLRRFREAVASHSMLEMEHRLRRHDGAYRICHIRAVPVPDASGSAQEWVGTHTDITERVEFERSLRESEARFRALADDAPVMIWMTRPDGWCEWLNARWYEFTGQTPAQAAGFGWLDAVHPEDAPGAEQAFMAATRSGTAFSFEYRLRRADGSYRWCVDSASPRRDAAGAFVGYIGSVSDITERVRMEEGLAAENRVLELIATNAPLQEVLDTLVLRLESQSTDGMLGAILLMADDGQVLLRGAAPSLPEAYRAASNGLPVRSGVGSCGTAAFERRTIVASDLSRDPRWADARELAAEHGLASCTSNPILGSDGRVLGTLALYYREPRTPSERDMELARLGTHLAGIVLEKHQLDGRLRRSLDAEQQARRLAERANRAKDEFLATLSHELRSPLNSILGWAAIMRMRGGLPAELAQGVDVIERNARAQSQIIADLLDMSSIIAGKLRLEHEPVSLGELVRSAVDTAMPMASAKQVRIEAHVEPGASVEIEGDPNRLQQVMWNLLSNAIKFTPREGRIDVMLARDGDSARIEVADTGSGIAAEFLPHVFDRFRQADPSISRRHGGLGLGLSIVRSLVEMHGGEVEAVSEGAGRGARFVVRLPLRAAERAGGGLPAPTAARLEGVRALVVDDDPDARTVTQWLLESAGAAVSVAGSGDEGLAALTAARFDVVVSDIGMPGMDGYDFLRHVRAGKAGGQVDVPAIALTAYARHQDRALAQEAGFDRHLAKPVDAPVLLDAVAALARRSEAA